MLLSFPFAALGFQAGSLASLESSRVLRTHSYMAAAEWSAVEGSAAPGIAASALDDLKEAGTATLWKSMRISPRSVSLRELCSITKLDEKVLDPTATEFSLEDIQDVAVKVLIGCTVGATLFAVGSDAIGMDAGMRFTGTYLFAGIPIAGLAIGSTAPGLLFLPVEAFRSMTANEEEKRIRAERVCKHEASHLLCAYVLGLPIQEVAVGDGKGPRVVVYDEERVQQPGQFVQPDDVNPLAIVAMSGMMAEADAYGKAFGANEDLQLLNSMLLRCSPPLSSQQQQDATRFAALTAWTIIKKHERAYDAITTALSEGKGLADCLAAAESAEQGRSAADTAEAAAKAEAMAKETPQEKAARERAEDAARGRF